jgi:hypothetical protein
MPPETLTHTPAPAKQLPRFRRASPQDRPAFRLTDRDRDLLKIIYDYRFITADLLQDLAPAVSLTKRQQEALGRLKQLFEARKADASQTVTDERPQMTAVLIPHALRAVAGLYRLFWLETHPCHLYSGGSNVPDGFGVPWDVFDPSTLLLQAFCINSSVTADIGLATYVYNQGYAWVNNTWQQTTFTCTGGQIVSDAWCPNSAAATLPNSATRYLAYTCNWTGTKWNCGCRDQACTQNFWQLQGIQP